MRVVSFQLANVGCAIDAAQVLEILRPQPITPVPRARRTVAGLVNVRGQILPVIDLRIRLGVAATGEPMHVLVRAGELTASLLVDRVGDVLDVDPAQVSSPPSTLEPSLRGLVAGGLMLSDRLVLVLAADRALTLEDDGAMS